MCCFLHWIQPVNPHFYATLYYNGSPHIITHLPIDSDRIVGVQFSFQLIDMPVDIFIFSLYFVSTNYPIDEYMECLPLLWRYLKLIVIAV